VERQNRDLQGALRYSFRLLNYRDRSLNELFCRITEKGFSEDIANEAINRLKDSGLVDDRKFAEALRRDSLNRKHLGRKGTLHYITAKGISREIAEEVIGDESDYIETAERLVEKKLKLMAGLQVEVKKRRLYGLLSRRGFSHDIAIRIIKEKLKEEIQ
jgi:regulatory protein